ncbi:MAG TPA: DUF1810 domain-containing protein [Tepidisphaeraceae bacterium]|jgi:uncharacterized protein (DUF1810 family)
MTNPDTPDAPDSHDLARFLHAQEPIYAQAVSELRSGRKQSHWMWFIFPQYAGLGLSSTSQHYAIKSLAEARAYLTHRVLGPRLIECAQAAVIVNAETATDLLGQPDDAKLRSCATLFAALSPEGSVFHQLLEKYFNNHLDPATLRLLSPDARG